MNTLPKDIEDIILDYKEDLEQYEMKTYFIIKTVKNIMKRKSDKNYCDNYLYKTREFNKHYRQYKWLIKDIITNKQLEKLYNWSKYSIKELLDNEEREENKYFIRKLIRKENKKLFKIFTKHSQKFIKNDKIELSGTYHSIKIEGYLYKKYKKEYINYYTYKKKGLQPIEFFNNY